MVKEVVNIPVFCAGRMDNPDMALEAIQDGVCDVIDLGRQLLADPDYCNKLRSGRLGEIRPYLAQHFLTEQKNGVFATKSGTLFYEQCVKNAGS